MRLMRRLESFPLFAVWLVTRAVCEVQATIASERGDAVERLHLDQKHMSL